MEARQDFRPPTARFARRRALTQVDHSVQLTPNRSSVRTNGQISFPMLECWNPLAELAIIAADVDKRRVSCRISLEVLCEKFEASRDDPMLAVSENRPALQAVARKLIETGAFEEDGSIRIRSENF